VEFLPSDSRYSSDLLYFRCINSKRVSHWRWADGKEAEWNTDAVAAETWFPGPPRLNTGECVVGNLGSDQRFDYSVLGDDAKPPASKARPRPITSIILGERTALQVPQFAMLEIDLILVVGKTKPVRIFFLLGDESVRATSAFATLESAHDSMIHAYRRKDWETAHRELESCRSQAPEIVQYVYELYEQRIADLQATTTPPDWDGVYAALMK
jgi:adenylate cyclase